MDKSIAFGLGEIKVFEFVDYFLVQCGSLEEVDQILIERRFWALDGFVLDLGEIDKKDSLYCE